MKTKVGAVVFLAVACVCFLAVEGASQNPTGSPPPPVAPSPPPLPPAVSPAPPSFTSGLAPSARAEDEPLEQLVQALKNVRQQQKALAAEEEALLGRIAQKVEAQRKALQRAEELLHQLRQEKAHPEKNLLKGEQKQDKLGSDTFKSEQKLKSK